MVQHTGDEPSLSIGSEITGREPGLSKGKWVTMAWKFSKNRIPNRPRDYSIFEDYLPLTDEEVKDFITNLVKILSEFPLMIKNVRPVYFSDTKQFVIAMEVAESKVQQIYETLRKLIRGSIFVRISPAWYEGVLNSLVQKEHQSKELKLLLTSSVNTAAEEMIKRGS